MRVCQFDFARRGSSASRQRISRAGGVWGRRCGNTRCRRRRRIIKAEGIFHKVPRLPPPHPSIYSKNGSANDGTIGERVPWRFARQVDFPVQKKNSATNGYPYAKQDGWHPKTLTAFASSRTWQVVFFPHICRRQRFLISAWQHRYPSYIK